MNTRLFVFRTGEGRPSPEVVQGADQLTARLDQLGVEYAQWTGVKALPPGAQQAEILALHQQQVDAVSRRFGYQSVDVVRLTPEHPTAAAARQKFLAEHTHDDDEARFFAEGGGTFYLHFPARELVGALACTAGDWVRVPAGTRHWFDMGERPRFAAIRLFTRPDGWVASFTGSEIAASYPTHDALVAS
jgi:1,2-dihydroxy-3-keto-5-methylthiopentene dioxygenase